MLNVFFAGTPDCAVPALREIAKNYRIAGILTSPAALAGRGKKYVESAVFRAAQELKAQNILPQNTPVLTPDTLTAEFRSAVQALQPDILVCFAYGKIFGPKTLALFPQGALNIHPSLLPRWRGPSPVPAAIAAGDTVTGVTVQYMAQEMDAGDIVIQHEVPIEPDDTAETLLNRCALLGSDLIVQALNRVQDGTVQRTRQDSSQASYCRLLEKDDGRINWYESAQAIGCKIRAHTPWPGAFAQWNNTKLAILHAHPYKGSTAPEQPAVPGLVLGTDKMEGILVQTGNGILAIQMLQRETKKAMQWKDFLNGVSGFTGEILQ